MKLQNAIYKLQISLFVCFILLLVLLINFYSGRETIETYIAMAGCIFSAVIGLRTLNEIVLSLMPKEFTEPMDDL